MQVRDIMTANVVSVSEDTPVREVAQVLNRRRISGVPVCDGDGHIVGVISEFDLIAKQEAQTAAEAMSRNVISVMEETDVDEVRYLLVQRRIKRVPVLRGQKLVGIVSRADLVREIAFTWICQVCGNFERGATPPQECPKCGVPSGYEQSATPPIEGADTGATHATCPTCGQALPA